jgi:hypothetical protein
MKTRNSLTTTWLGVCLTAGVSLATLAGSALASLTVTKYGEAATMPDGMSFVNYNFPFGNFWGVDLSYNNTAGKPRQVLTSGTTEFNKFCYTRGSDLTDNLITNAQIAYYYQANVDNIYYAPNGFQRGAQNSDLNFANFDFNGDNTFETVAQFHFDTGGGGYLIAVAQDNSGDPLSISAGKLLIEQGPGTYGLAAVPEVTSSFTLLGLITSGLLLRRRGRFAR